MIDKEVLLKCIEPNVKALLKAPVSAVFCSPNELIIHTNGDGSLKVEGYVSSQNSYGAMIKNDFSCTARERPDGEYTISNCTVGVKTGTQKAVYFVVAFIVLSIITWLIATLETDALFHHYGLIDQLLIK
ncbi:MAG: hypothetical protein K6C13_03960 [Oscillospiraceae bacterium]|nr:hypothetical protein [Oscillospiraceae bacterium]